MSRSYKHVPVCGGRSGFSKTQAKRRVRRNKMKLSFSKGGYKKFYDSWEIRDYFGRCTWKEYWQKEWEWYNWYLENYPKSPRYKKPVLKESYRDWWRAYKMK